MLAITSESKKKRRIPYRSTHFGYAVTYIIITLVVLLFLNIYSSKISQTLFYNSKETTMIQKCQLLSSDIANLEIINTATISKAVQEMGGLKVSRLIITDQRGLALYDSSTQEAAKGKYILLPEVVKALQKNDVFSWSYHDGTMQSKAATPILSYGTLLGCVYMMEYDTQQGALIQKLQYNTLIITLILEVLIVIFSIAFSRAYTQRLRRIMVSMRIIRNGDYNHKVNMGGNDELTVLGREFNDLVERLQISEQKRNNFVSDASHELKTPLASIKLLSDSILQNDMDLDTVKEFVGDIGNEADRLNRMTEKLLALSHIETQSDSDCEITYIAPTVERVVRMLSPIAEKNQIEIAVELQKDCPILILEDDLYQIIYNLVENGIKYNVPNGMLTVRIHREENDAILTVQDTGTGIPIESLDHIFERFYRVDKARSRKSGGSGLGLSIVRNMVERNQGHIYVESTVGKGTVFTVVFPIFDMEDEQ